MHRKKILALSLVLALSLALCACGESGGNDTADQAGPCPAAPGRSSQTDPQTPWNI